MNVAELKSKLIAAARREAVRDEVPYAFEQRVMARLAHPAVPDSWGLWAQALWRAAAPCIAITLLLTAWSLSSPEVTGTTGEVNLNQEIERAVLASADQEAAPDFLQ
jgi:hypothetical protein